MKNNANPRADALADLILELGGLKVRTQQVTAAIKALTPVTDGAVTEPGTCGARNDAVRLSEQIERVFAQQGGRWMTPAEVARHAESGSTNSFSKTLKRLVDRGLYEHEEGRYRPNVLAAAPNM